MIAVQIVILAFLQCAKAFMLPVHSSTLEKHQFRKEVVNNYCYYKKHNAKIYHDVICNGSSGYTPLFSSPSKSMDVLGDDGEGLTKEKISSIIEITFIESCLQIATGYVDVLKMFLATVRAAHGMKIPISELVESIEEMDVKNNSANRQLTPDEINLRTLWMDVSYLTLECLQQNEEGKNVDSVEENEISLVMSTETRQTYEKIIGAKVDQFLGKDEKSLSNSSCSEPPTFDDPAQAAIMKYSLKIIDLMLVVEKEGRIAGESYGLDEDGVGPPRPPIPGAFE